MNIGPFENKGKGKGGSSCENKAIGSNYPNAHSIVYGKLVEHIHNSKRNLHQNHQ